MKYKERIIEHNLHKPREYHTDTLKLQEVDFDSSVISHHPKSFEYYFTHGLVVNDRRYIVKEFFVKHGKLYAILTEDENTYYEMYLSFLDENIIEDLKKDISNLKAKDKQFDKRLSDLENNRKQNQTLSINDRTISISGGNSIELPADKDTVYDDTELKNRVDEIEKVKYKDKDTIVYPYNGGELVTVTKSSRLGENFYQTFTYRFKSSGKRLTEQFIENILKFNIDLQEKNSITGVINVRTVNDFNLTKVARQSNELYSEQTFTLSNNTSLLVKLNTIWKDLGRTFAIELGFTLIYKEKDGDSLREYIHEFTADEIDSGEQAYISILVDGVEKGYSKINLGEVRVGMSNFGYRVYQQIGDNDYTKLETINE